MASLTGLEWDKEERFKEERFLSSLSTDDDDGFYNFLSSTQVENLVSSFSRLFEV